MKLKVAIIHKEQQIKTRNYRVWITKHIVNVEDGLFNVRKFGLAFLAPQPDFDALLLDSKYVLYRDDGVAPLQDDWKPVEIKPQKLLAATDERWLRVLSQTMYNDSLSSYLRSMLKSWFNKLTVKHNPKSVGIQPEDERCYHALDSGMLGLRPVTIKEAEQKGLTACPYCLGDNKKHEQENK